ncbi:DNA polymerase beta superfamily protein [Modestobacter sp. VKM Ac-2983]|uniref:DNA polymerase beta superfamily protein n=1 Tax=Modestobacter sp. VKM Ac-2983 TaxID=3004137 RepID=UPI003FA5CE66
MANRSGAGDLDVVICSARKWARLALAGNPIVLLPLFVPDAGLMHRDDAGVELVETAHRLISQLAADRFLGYLSAQRAAMTGETGAHTTGPSWWPCTGTTSSTPCTRARLGPWRRAAPPQFKRRPLGSRENFAIVILEERIHRRHIPY